MGHVRRTAELLDHVAAADPDRPALIVDDRPDRNDGTVWTYGELSGLVHEWAGALAEAGVAPGDRFVLADRGGARSTAVTVAAFALGAASAQVDPSLTRAEVRVLVDAAGCGPVAVAAEDAVAAVEGALVDALGAAEVLVAPDPAAVPGRPDPDPDRDALVLFTSGTTGTPKAVAIADGALLTRLTSYRAPFDPDRTPSRSIMCVPFFHVGGMLGLLLNLYGGDTTVVMPRFDAGRWIELVAAHRVGSCFLVPAMLARILDRLDAVEQRGEEVPDLSSLRVVAYGAAAAPVDLVRRAMDRWPGAAFANTFGQTETLGAYTTLGPDDHRDPARIGSVGRALPGVEIRVVDPTTGRDLEDGEVGELWVRTAQNVGVSVTADGWFATGDLARRDADGYLYPSGRMSEVINRGGEKFGPGEVADAVRSHPSVAAAAVVGVPDEEMGERVGVLVVPADGATAPTLEELREHCRTRLARFKLPEVVAYADELPHNDLGKLPRRVLLAALDAGSTGEER